MSKERVRFPALWQFFGAYLYEDWHDDYPDEWAALADFLDGEPLYAPNFRAEIAALLLDMQSENELRHLLLDDFRAAAMVENRGWKYRDWLQALSDHAAKTLGQP